MQKKEKKRKRTPRQTTMLNTIVACQTMTLNAIVVFPCGLKSINPNEQEIYIWQLQPYLPYSVSL
jgi:hypothetical protein